MNDFKEYELQCIFNKRASFYKKAMVREYENGRKELYSYNTLVAVITENNEVEEIGFYSQTTTRHQKEFLKQNGFSDKEIKEILKRG